MSKLNQQGIAHILIVVILLAGVVGGLVLIKNPAIFQPRAYDRSLSGPVSGPVTTFSNLNATLTQNSANFNFNYSNSAETLYKVHLSKTANFSSGVWWNFVTGSTSSLVNSNPASTWSDYACGKTYYWRVEAVWTGKVLSSIQGPVTVNCTAASPTPTTTPTPVSSSITVNLTPPSGSLTPYGSASITVNVTSRVSSGGYTDIRGKVSGMFTNMQPSRTYDIWFVSARGYTPVGARITTNSSGAATFRDVSFSEREDNSARVGFIRVAYAFDSNNPAPNGCSQYLPCLQSSFSFPQ
ncbi:hypothetical protein A3C26_01930 [Candidatus Daviesbacteria bacterium RIFCSPHIGHO2_02_FULL_39_12]|uniref:Uncharacterized protein n=2 Tax=Candidatus Daviesiibacteriota TaxID=1752718 RepID=A0A1F5JB90_9BACT|nr:MAG: hypothetical protein A3C26_01930 [Candidatus Daviesbacteria bacterium RIFCSPHIGHO2_02_FULL_39_12]OGE71474.1 MAG: hypothetical protein A3H40_03025 [Candidatus Daviesbacteria bacterium RIFCSPLOWO2_02_FULL_38_15]